MTLPQHLIEKLTRKPANVFWSLWAKRLHLNAWTLYGLVTRIGIKLQKTAHGWHLGLMLYWIALFVTFKMEVGSVTTPAGRKMPGTEYLFSGVTIYKNPSQMGPKRPLWTKQINIGYYHE